MKFFFNFLFLMLFLTTFSQENERKIDTIGTDILNALYTVSNDVLFKKNSNKTISYQNVVLGKISSVDFINTQEIVVFYADFNTVAILDNQLNLIVEISFQNTILFARKGITNTVWIFNADDNILELYDYKSKKTILSSQFIPDFEPIEMKSDFNFVKLIGKEKTLIFNRYLNLTDTIIH